MSERQPKGLARFAGRLRTPSGVDRVADNVFGREYHFPTAIQEGPIKRAVRRYGPGAALAGTVLGGLASTAAGNPHAADRAAHSGTSQTMRITAPSHPGVDFNLLSQRRDPAPQPTVHNSGIDHVIKTHDTNGATDARIKVPQQANPAALPKPFETIVVRSGNSGWTIGRDQAKEAGLKTDVPTINTLDHLLNGQATGGDATLQPGQKIHAFSSKVIKGVEKLAHAKLPKKGIPQKVRRELRRVQDELYLTDHYQAGKTFPETVHNDQKLDHNITGLIIQAEQKGSEVGKVLKEAGVNLSVAHSSEGAHKHHKTKKHHPGNAHHHENKSNHSEESGESKVSAPQIKHDVAQVMKQTGSEVLHKTTLHGKPNAWVKEQTTTISGVRLSDAQTNIINKVTEGSNPGVDFNHMTEKTSYIEATRQAEIFLAGIGTLSHQQLQQLHGKISEADFKRISEIAEANQLSGRTPKPLLTQEKQQEAKAFLDLVKEHASTIAKHADTIKKMVTFIAEHPDQREKVKAQFIHTFAATYEQALVEASSAKTGLTPQQQEQRAKINALNHETQPANTATPSHEAGSSTPSSSETKAPTYIIGNHRVLAPAHVEPGKTQTVTPSRTPEHQVLPNSHVYTSPAESRSLEATPSPTPSRTTLAPRVVIPAQRTPEASATLIQPAINGRLLKGSQEASYQQGHTLGLIEGGVALAGTEAAALVAIGAGRRWRRRRRTTRPPGRPGVLRWLRRPRRRLT